MFTGGINGSLSVAYFCVVKHFLCLVLPCFAGVAGIRAVYDIFLLNLFVCIYDDIKQVSAVDPPKISVVKALTVRTEIPPVRQLYAGVIISLRYASD